MFMKASVYMSVCVCVILGRLKKWECLWQNQEDESEESGLNDFFMADKVLYATKLLLQNLSCKI